MKQLKLARKQRRQEMRQWSAEWWQGVADEADKAAQSGDSRAVFAKLEELKRREGEGRRQLGRATVGDVDEERAAWEEHFRRISEGAGVVHGRAWGNIKDREGPAVWLGEDPTDMELSKALRKMKGGKAPSGDAVVAEMMKMGGGT